MLKTNLWAGVDKNDTDFRPKQVDWREPVSKLCVVNKCKWHTGREEQFWSWGFFPQCGKSPRTHHAPNPTMRKNVEIVPLTETRLLFRSQGTQTGWRRNSMLRSCGSETRRCVGLRLWFWLVPGSCQCGVQGVTMRNSRLYPRGSTFWRRKWTDLGWRIPVYRGWVASFTVRGGAPCRRIL